MLKIDTATLKDYETIDSIAQRSLSDSYQNVKSTEELDYMQDLQYSQAVMSTTLSDEQCTFIAKEDDICLGFVSVIQEGPELYHLTKIYVDPAYQNSGIGCALFNRVIEHIKERHQGCNVDLELYVNSHNKSVRFYHRVGMQKVRESIMTLDNNFTFVQDVYSITIKC